jgi:hypothetical protein
VKRGTSALALLLLSASAFAEPGWELPWGSGPGQVGRESAAGHQHGEPTTRGPQSFAVSARGELLVADTFNKRILEVAPDSAVREVPVAGPLPFAADLALRANGALAIADRGRYAILDPPRTYGERGDGATQLHELSRIAAGPGGMLASADDVKHRMILYADGVARASLPYESYGLAFDPHGRLHAPRFQTLAGFVLTGCDANGRPLPARAFDLASPLAIDLLDVDEDGVALALVPIPSSGAGKQQLLAIEPGGRARDLWHGLPQDATRTIVRGRDGRLWRAGPTPKAWVVRPLDPPTSPPPAAGALVTGKEILRVPAPAIGRPIALLALGAEPLLVGEDGRWARGSATGRLDAPHRPLSSVVHGPGGEVWAVAESRPEVHRYDASALKAVGTLTLAGWARAPDILTASPEGQILTCDRATAQWLKHDMKGAEVLRFDQASPGTLDRRSELITINDTEEPFTKAVLEFDSNGNFFKVIATIQEPTRPTGVRFLGNAPDGDLLIGYWLGVRARVRRYTIDGVEKPGYAFDLPAGARVAVADWPVGSDGKTMVATREGRDLVVRSF